MLGKGSRGECADKEKWHGTAPPREDGEDGEDVVSTSMSPPARRSILSGSVWGDPRLQPAERDDLSG